MPGKRPRQIQRTTSMSQLGGGGMVMGARFSQTAPESFHGDAGFSHRGLPAPPPPKQELLETMEVCAGAEGGAAPGAFMEDNFNSMAIDDGVEESSYASHTVPRAVSQVNHAGGHSPFHVGAPHQALHLGSAQDIPMAPQASFYRGHEAARSVQLGHFLSACNLCSKQLGHGRDVFIYRGDRAFCSVECRHLQIVADEMREKCGTGATKEGVGSKTPACNSPSTKQVGTAAAA